METPREDNPYDLPETCEECPCPKTWCERQHKCRECYEYHAHRSPKNKLPFCLRGDVQSDPAA